MFRKTLAVRHLGRAMSTAAGESPKSVMARNLLLLSQISAAQTEAELQAIAAKGLPQVDLKNLPEELAPVRGFFGGAALTSSTPLQADSKAWHNLPFADRISAFSSFPEVWPFIVGFG